MSIAEWTCGGCSSSFGQPKRKPAAGGCIGDVSPLQSLVLTFGDTFRRAPSHTSQLPEAVRNVGIDQRLNEQLPLDIEFAQ